MALQFLGREHVFGLGRAAGEGPRRPGLHPLFEVVAGQVDERHGAIKQSPDVIGRGGVGIVSRPGSVAVGVGDHALPVGDEQPRAVGGEPDGRRIPANRNEAQASRPALLRHVPDAQGVDVGVGDEEPRTIRRDRQGVGGVARRGVGRERGHERFGRFAGVEVDHRHAVAVRVGHEQPRSVGRHHHLVGMVFDGDALHDAPFLRVDHRHGRLAPERHVEPAPPGISHAGPGVRGVGDGLFQERVGPLGDRRFGGIGDRGAGRRRGVGEQELVHDRGGPVRGEANPGDRVSPDVGDIDRAVGIGDLDAAGDSPQFRIPQGHGAVGHQRALDEPEAEERFRGASRHPEPVAVAGEGEPLERLFKPGLREQFPLHDVEHGEFVRAVAAMQDDRVPPVGVHGDRRGEVADTDLAAGRPQRPLVGQDHRTVGLGPRRAGRRHFGSEARGEGCRPHHRDEPRKNEKGAIHGMSSAVGESGGIMRPKRRTLAYPVGLGTTLTKNSRTIR